MLILDKTQHFVSCVKLHQNRIRSINVVQGPDKHKVAIGEGQRPRDQFWQPESRVQARIGCCRNPARQPYT